MSDLNVPGTAGQDFIRQNFFRLLGSVLEVDSLALLQKIPITKNSKVLVMDMDNRRVIAKLVRLIGENGKLVSVTNAIPNKLITKTIVPAGNYEISTPSSREFGNSTEGDFDYIFSRLQLSVGGNAEQTLLQFYKILKPRGEVFLEEFNLLDFRAFPECTAFDRLAALAKKVRQPGIDADKAKSRYKEPLEKTGFKNVQSQLIPPIFLQKKFKQLASLSFELFSSELLEQEVAKPAELRALLYELKSFEKRSNSLISLPPVYQVSGKKPA
ncbi:MAG: hypothetical protein AAFZ15_28910 [Bacteroidota bacterium]